MSVAEIESAIRQRPAGDRAELTAWLQEYHGSAGDRQIEDDLEAGRLEGLLAEAAQEYEAGLARPL